MINNYTNHIALVIDESSSMAGHAGQLIKVTDAQVAYLARRSQELDQETRVSVYMFSNTVRCLIYEKDVLRLPSIAGLYRPHGRTALIDATLKSQEDLRQTATLYGDHAFLTFVLTDGEENESRRKPAELRKWLTGLAVMTIFAPSCKDTVVNLVSWHLGWLIRENSPLGWFPCAQATAGWSLHCPKSALTTNSPQLRTWTQRHQRCWPRASLASPTSAM